MLVFTNASIALLTIIGAAEMRNLELHRLAVVGSVLAMVPCTPGAVLGIPCGIWALFVMSRREVRAAFDVGGNKRLAKAAFATPEAIENDRDRVRWLVRGPAKGTDVEQRVAHAL